MAQEEYILTENQLVAFEKKERKTKIYKRNRISSSGLFIVARHLI
jgi:hypothetical protein